MFRCVMIWRIDNVEVNATTRFFGFVQDRIIVTAERKRADQKSKKMSMMPVQERDGGKRKRALTWPWTTHLTERNEQKASATNLAGSTQPLGRRTIFLGHNKFCNVSMESSCHIPSYYSLQCKCLTHVGTLVAAFMSP
jgi:hypothetical protein